MPCWYCLTCGNDPNDCVAVAVDGGNSGLCDGNNQLYVTVLAVCFYGFILLVRVHRHRALAKHEWTRQHHWQPHRIVYFVHLLGRLQRMAVKSNRLNIVTDTLRGTEARLRQRDSVIRSFTLKLDTLMTSRSAPQHPV